MMQATSIPQNTDIAPLLKYTNAQQNADAQLFSILSHQSASKIQAPFMNTSAALTSGNGRGWVYNISAGFRFSSSTSKQLQISYSRFLKPLLVHTDLVSSADAKRIARLLINKQFDYLCSLLRAGNCETIYFDAKFSEAQFTVIRQLQSGCDTELVNARMVYMFKESKIA